MSQHPILMYGEPPGAGREGREEKEGGREAGGGADGASERRAGASAVQVNYYPQHGENTSDDEDRDRHGGGRDICAIAVRYLFAQTRRGESGTQPERINLGAIFNELDFCQCKVSFLFLRNYPKENNKRVKSVSDAP